MQITAHADARMNQRGINKRHLGIVLEHGEPDGDKLTLSAKAARHRAEALRQELKALEAVAKKGGVTIVVADDRLITTYRVNSFSLSVAKKVRG